jgi:virginiamycin B lyase
MRWFSSVVSGRQPRHSRPCIEVLEGRQLLSGQVVELPTPLSDNSGPDQLALGPDGNYWYTESAGSKIGRITPAGVVTEFPTRAFTGGIAVGPDGNLWFTEPSNGFSVVNYIGRITPAGVVSEFAIPTLGCNAGWITSGPDGNLWFTEATGDSIGRITPAGVITEFPLPANTTPLGITAGPDGNLRFTESGPDNTAVFNPASPGNVAVFCAGQANSGPAAITAGHDGALWFTLVGGNEIGRIGLDGSVILFPLPAGSETGYGQIAAGPDGNVWFTEYGNNIGAITPGGHITEYPLRTIGGTGVSPFGLAVGTTGGMAFTESFGNRLGEITTARSDAFIGSLYGNDLGRAADAAGLAAWSNILFQQGKLAVIQGIGRSSEADKHLVDSIYQNYLARPADPFGEMAFINYLQHGGTEEGVLTAVLSSPEYFNRVTAGSANASSAFVQALYRHLLSRTAAPAEINAWVSVMPTIGRAGIVAGFVGSFEYRRDVVFLYYLGLLDRVLFPPTAAELASWANSPLDLYSIRLAFETSAEYWNNH